MTPVIHAALRKEQLLPQEHVVDTGDLDAELLVTSRREYNVDLVGPTRLDDHWQAQERTGFALEHFRIDWDRQQAVCPEGHTSNSWTPGVDRRTNRVIKIKFSGRDCRRCPSQELCTRSQKKYPRRTITIREREEFEALLAARQRVRTGEYRATYAKRAGCEGTLSRGVRRCRLRRTRFRGQERTHLGQVLTATGLNDRPQLRAPRRVVRRHPARQGPLLAVRHAAGWLSTQLRARLRLRHQYPRCGRATAPDQAQPGNAAVATVQLKNATGNSLPTIHVDDARFVASTSP